MNYAQLAALASEPRLKRYKIACAGSKDGAVELYFKNIELSAEIFKMISVFEVFFRNRINNWLRAELGDDDWLRTMAQPGSDLDVRANATFSILKKLLTKK